MQNLTKPCWWFIESHLMTKDLRLNYSLASTLHVQYYRIQPERDAEDLGIPPTLKGTQSFQALGSFVGMSECWRSESASEHWHHLGHPKSQISNSVVSHLGSFLCEALSKGPKVSASEMWHPESQHMLKGMLQRFTKPMKILERYLVREWSMNTHSNVFAESGLQ